MKRLEQILIIIMVLIALLIWAGVAWSASELWSAPLGPAIQLPSQTVTPPGTVTHAPGLTLLPSATPKHFVDVPTPTLTQHGAYCGGPEATIILAIGSDTRAQNYLYGLADVIRLVRVDFVTPKVTVLEFPRDLWVQIPDLDPKHNITYEKLNQAYLYGNPGMGYYTGPGEGPTLLARTLELNFGARPENYLAANMNTFTRLVDAVGGINVTLPYNVDGRRVDQQTRQDLYFEAGTHHLRGKEALMLARLRIGTNADRSTNQSLVLCGLRNALIDPSNLSRLPKIIDSFDNAIQTDLSPEKISQLACLAPLVKPENIVFATFPPNLLTAARVYDKEFKKEVFIWKADYNILRTYVTAFQAGVWPQAVRQSISETPSASQEPAFNCP
jgi:LCP family protein required for cell wall assembly